MAEEACRAEPSRQSTQHMQRPWRCEAARHTQGRVLWGCCCVLPRPSMWLLAPGLITHQVGTSTLSEKRLAPPIPCSLGKAGCHPSEGIDRKY